MGSMRQLASMIRHVNEAHSLGLGEEIGNDTSAGGLEEDSGLDPDTGPDIDASGPSQRWDCATAPFAP